VQWLLWHGIQYRAGETIKFFLDDVDAIGRSKRKPFDGGVSAKKQQRISITVEQRSPMQN
jgi:hypothetical protein